MALIGGVRLANALTSGNISGSCLQTLLGTASRNADLETLLQSPSYSCYLGTSNAASSALVNSNLAHEMITTANIGGAVLYSSPDFANNFANSTCAFQKLICDDNVFRLFSTSPVSITCAFGNANSTFNTTVVQSNNYVCRIISNSTLRTCLFTNEGSVDALASNPNTVAALYSDSYVAPLFLACGISVQYAFDNPTWVDVAKGGDSVRFLTCGCISPYIGSSPVSAYCYLMDACAANTIVFVAQGQMCGFSCICGTTGMLHLNCGFGNFVCGCGYHSFCGSPYVLRCLNCLLGCGANVAFLNEIATNRQPYFFRPLRFCHSLMTKFACPCTCFYGGYCNANTDGLLAANWYPFTLASDSKASSLYFGGQFFDIMNCRVTNNRNGCDVVGIKAYSLQNLTVCTANTTAVTPPVCSCPVCGCRPLSEDEVRRRMNCMFNAIVATGRSCTFTSANNGNFILFGLGFRNHHLDFGVNCVVGCLGTGGYGTIVQHCCHCSLKTCGLLLCPMLYSKNAGGKWDIVCVCIPNTIYDCRSCGVVGGTTGCGLLDHWCRHTNNCGFLTTCITSSFACENNIWVGFVIRSYCSPCTGEITGYVYGCVAANNDPVWLCWNANCGSIPQTMFNYCCGWFTGFGPGIIHRCSDASPGTLLTPPLARAWTHNTTANCGFYAWNFIVGKIDHSTGLKSITPPCCSGGGSGMVDLCVSGYVYCCDCWRWLFCGFGENQQLGPNNNLPHYEIMECYCLPWGPMPRSGGGCWAGAPSTKSAIMCCYACGNRARIWLFNYDPSHMVQCGCSNGCGASFGGCRTVIQSLSVDVCGDNAYFYPCRHYPAVNLVCHFGSMCSLGGTCANAAVVPVVNPPASTFALANTLMWISGDLVWARAADGSGGAWPCYVSRSRYCDCYVIPVGTAMADFYQGFDDRMSSCFAFTGCHCCGGIIVITNNHAGGLNTDNCGVNCGCGLIGNQCAAGRGAAHGVNWQDFTTGVCCMGMDQIWWFSRVNHTVINPEKCAFLSFFFCNRCNEPHQLSCFFQAIALPPNDFMANTCFCTILLRGCHSHIKVGQGASCFGPDCAGRTTRPLMYLGALGNESGLICNAFTGDLDGTTYCCISHQHFAMSCSLRTMGGPEVAFCNFMQIPFTSTPLSGIIGGYPNINCRFQLAVAGYPCGNKTIYCDHVRCPHHGIVPFNAQNIMCQCLGTTAGGLNAASWAGNGTCVRTTWMCKPTYFPGANNSPMIYSLYQYNSSSLEEFGCVLKYANGVPCFLNSCCSANYTWNIIKLDEVFSQTCGFFCGV